MKSFRRILCHLCHPHDHATHQSRSLTRWRPCIPNGCRCPECRSPPAFHGDAPGRVGHARRLRPVGAPHGVGVKGAGAVRVACGAGRAGARSAPIPGARSTVEASWPGSRAPSSSWEDRLRRETTVERLAPELRPGANAWWCIRCRGRIARWPCRRAQVNDLLVQTCNVDFSAAGACRAHRDSHAGVVGVFGSRGAVTRALAARRAGASGATALRARICGKH